MLGGLNIEELLSSLGQSSNTATANQAQQPAASQQVSSVFPNFAAPATIYTPGNLDPTQIYGGGGGSSLGGGGSVGGGASTGTGAGTNPYASMLSSAGIDPNSALGKQLLAAYAAQQANQQAAQTNPNAVNNALTTWINNPSPPGTVNSTFASTNPNANVSNPIPSSGSDLNSLFTLPGGSVVGSAGLLSPGGTPISSTFSGALPTYNYTVPGSDNMSTDLSSIPSSYGSLPPSTAYNPSDGALISDTPMSPSFPVYNPSGSAPNSQQTSNWEDVG